MQDTRTERDRDIDRDTTRTAVTERPKNPVLSCQRAQQQEIVSSVVDAKGQLTFYVTLARTAGFCSCPRVLY